jgi:hypothetical protein
MPGAVTLEVEVTNISAHCFWVFLGEEELWFRQATVDQISDVQRPTPDHLYWPQLDIDLSVESIRVPGAFPLTSKAPSREDSNTKAV